jgi:hypothetical protein
VSAKDTHRAQKWGGSKPLFAAPICACAHSVLSQADKWLPLITSTPSICLPLTVPPVPVPFSSPPPVPPRSTSPPSHYTSASTCVTPTLSSVSSSIHNCPPGHLPSATPYRVCPSLCQQPRLSSGFPVSIQLRSR